jgi:hypothetical protein
MITTFGDFPNFLQNIGVSLKYQCYDILFQNANFFAKFSGENISKSYNIGPSLQTDQRNGSVARPYPPLCPDVNDGRKHEAKRFSGTRLAYSDQVHA